MPHIANFAAFMLLLLPHIEDSAAFWLFVLPQTSDSAAFLLRLLSHIAISAAFLLLLLPHIADSTAFLLLLLPHIADSAAFFAALLLHMPIFQIAFHLISDHFHCIYLSCILPLILKDESDFAQQWWLAVPPALRASINNCNGFTSPLLECPCATIVEIQTTANHRMRPARQPWRVLNIPC